jgi:hypothetical protein
MAAKIDINAEYKAFNKAANMFIFDGKELLKTLGEKDLSAEVERNRTTLVALYQTDQTFVHSIVGPYIDKFRKEIAERDEKSLADADRIKKILGELKAGTSIGGKVKVTTSDVKLAEMLVSIIPKFLACEDKTKKKFYGYLDTLISSGDKLTAATAVSTKK